MSMTKDEIAKALSNNEDIDSGNIVAWGGGLYIVAENDKDNHRFNLLHADNSNCSSHPSAEWPTPEDGYAAVKYVAGNMKEFFETRIIDKAFEDFGDL